MTFLHMLNCYALTLGPSFVVYKGTKLAEYHDVWNCFQAALAYAAAQGVKYVALATLVPSRGADAAFSLPLALVAAVLSLIDLYAMHSVLHRRAGVADVKILALGVGWATGEATLTRLAPLWIGARGAEFDWKWLLLSMQASVSLLASIAVATFIWLRARKHQTAAARQTVSLALFAWLASPVLLSWLQRSQGLPPSSVFLVDAAIAASLAVLARSLYLAQRAKDR